MGLLSINPLRSREATRSKLPLYKELALHRVPSPTKERYSDVEFSSDEEDEDGDLTDSSISSPPSSRGSRQTSSSSAPMLHKTSVTAMRRRPASRYLYRLPNKVIRFLCLGMVSTIVIFIFVLVRASQVENRRIAEGKIEKKPPIAVAPPWESFNFLTRYYGGIRTLVPFAENEPQYPRAQDEGPYDTDQRKKQQQQQQQEKSGKAARGLEHTPATVNAVPPSKPFAEYPGAVLPKSADGIHECFLDEQNTVRIPPARYFDGQPKGFPNSVLGSYEVLSLPEDICFDRFGRYGPYGYGYSTRTGGLGIGEHGDKEGFEAVWETTKKIDFRNVNWAEAQRRCYKANAGLYQPVTPLSSPPRGFYITESKAEATPEKVATREPGQAEGQADAASASHPAKALGNIPRTAIVVRCWDEFFWGEEDILNLRAIIAELSLASGGRYDVHLLVQVRNDAMFPVWADDETYSHHITQTVPKEFQGMVTLWSETQMLAIYQGLVDLWTKGPELPLHGSYRGLQMAMQYFAHKHPEYEHFWQWEMDIRYTGHYYDLLTKMESFAKAQPRKGLWERNARFYMPYAHGTWEDFKQMARVQTKQGAVGPDNMWDKVPGVKSPSHPTQKPEENIWGPQRPVDQNDWFEYGDDPVPPTSYERDRYTWGVGEEADLITLNPIFDPEGTTWGLADDITGYNESAGIGKPPRRAQIITASRMSRRLLRTMHRETAFKKHHAFPEMWPATAALQHGYKAVYAPHPEFVDREWPTEYMARVLNAGRNGAAGGSRTSVFGDREHNLKGLTWYYNAGFAANLYKRWLGLRVNNDGGEQFEITRDESADDLTVNTMQGGEGRMCLPPMLLHPVKDIELPVEGEAAEAVVVVVESDPAA
ncbi:hypothetical protein B0T22DRAFT_86040 [Podospora appendiculata]|uniref:Uncharacterized protein n=1 Tax=Podospora appendiculata TaxID=314037 RepID=A0AAE0XKA9_9PEZI|nr:hypothetical protein B0T22DRAFT_86040 [Podospora appendiculata]